MKNRKQKLIEGFFGLLVFIVGAFFYSLDEKSSQIMGIYFMSYGVCMIKH